MSAETYQRAERFLSWNLSSAVLNNDVIHHWVPGEEMLWYRRATEKGWAFVLADAVSREKSPAFDHARLAEALSAASGEPVDDQHLAVASISSSGTALQRVTTEGESSFSCTLDEYRCEKLEKPAQAPPGLVSPDGTYRVVLKEHNLWVASPSQSEPSALTTDGNAGAPWSTRTESSTFVLAQRRLGEQVVPVGLFSPTGNRLLTYRLNHGSVPELAVLQNVVEGTNLRPVVHQYRYPFPGGEQPTAELAVFELDSGRRISIAHESVSATYMDPVTKGYVFWNDSGESLFLLNHDPTFRKLSLFEIDADTGAVRTLITENREATVWASPMFPAEPLLRVLGSGDLVWPSERDGSLHLYLYGRNGKLKHRLTSGNIVVREIVRVDETRGLLYFTAGGGVKGQDPYYRQLHVVGLDGRKQQLLTRDDSDHAFRTPPSRLTLMFNPSAGGADSFAFSESGSMLVDSYSRPDRPTVTVIRSADGKPVLELETASLGSAVAADHNPPEPFEVLAADGETQLYGSLFKPSTFDSARTYPVVDSIYPGPQIARVSKRFMGDFFDAQAVAELGFIVVAVDGRGTPLRSAAFRERSYGNLGLAGSLDDHLAAIRELARTRPYMDLGRVGIYGTSGGGFATVRAMLDYPDFYKVGVASAGNHDLEMYVALWGEYFEGPFDAESYARADSYVNAAQLKGKLLMAHGDMDDNVHPAHTMRVVDALIRNNKDFDLLIMPNVDHGISRNPYFIRRQWDYLVTHLMGMQPPAGYSITPVAAAPR